MRAPNVYTACLIGCLYSAAPPIHAADLYSVTADSELKRLTVEACFDTPAPRALVALSDEARALTRQDRAGRIPLERGEHCVEYLVDLSSAKQTGHWRGPVVRGQDAVLLSPSILLWYPDDDRAFDIRFELPTGMQISAAWPRAGEQRFHVGERPTDWNGKIALGRMHLEDMMVAGSRLEVALLEGTPPVDKTMVLDWLRANAEAVAGISGSLPVPRTQVLIMPLGKGGEPVPWGQLSRGGGESIHLYIDQHYDKRAFMNDWVLSHELSHLLHPFISTDGRWLYEGLASYYQSVARARAGLMSEQDAWEELHAGFNRGRFQTKRGQDLREASSDMMRTRAFMRVYWSGAAFFLLADLELRERSAGRQSLDTALRVFGERHLPSNRLWTPEEVIQALDEASDSDVFSTLYQRHIPSDQFPDTKAAFARLGLIATSGRTLKLSDNPTSADLRAAIMGPR
ncbi:MAG: hypothetical protein ACPG4N_07620 [Gammaproteobacteria bacterium]